MNDDNRIKEIVESLSEEKLIDTDQEFNKNKFVEEHEKDYSKILEAYSDYLQKNLDRKHCFKGIIFWVSISLLVMVVILFIDTIHTLSLNRCFDLVTWISQIAPVVISFLTVFIVIPQIITKYLFNTEEEKYMSEIIKNIQDYDRGKKK